MSHAKQTLEAILRGEVEPDERGCILWPHAIDPHGYARARINGENQRVARHVLSIVVSPPPSDQHHACHAPHDVCGNRHCVSPEHLSWKTPKENMADQYDDTTRVRGEEHPQSVLTADDVVTIRTMSAEGLLDREIAEEYGVSSTTIADAVRGDTWTHVGGPVADGPRWRYKVSPDDRKRIRRRYAAGGVIMQELADAYGVSLSAIHRIIKKERE